MWYRLLSFIGMRPAAIAVGLIGLVLTVVVTSGSAFYSGKKADYWENTAALYEQNITVKDWAIEALNNEIDSLDRIAKVREQEARKMAEKSAARQDELNEIKKSNPTRSEFLDTPIPEWLRDIN